MILWHDGSIIPPPRYTLSVSENTAMHSKHRGMNKRQAMSSDYWYRSISDYRQNGHCHRTALERPDHAVCPADGIRKALVMLILGRLSLTAWVFVASITENFSLGFDGMHAYEASLDLRHHVLGLEMREEVPLRPTGCDRLDPLYDGKQRRSSGSVW
jgi:hypothetical protein